MTPEQFAYWLQGYAELNAAPPTAEQWQSIRDHLATVFNKVTPNYWRPNGPVAPGPIEWARIATPLVQPRSECIVQTQRGAQTTC